MENFRNTIKKRLTLTAIYDAAALLLIVLCHLFREKYQLPDFAVGFATGAFVGIQLVMVYYIAKYLAALRNEAKLKALFIFETDERNKFIKAKIAASGLMIFIGALGLATLAAVFINKLVFLTLLIVLYFAALVTVALKVYYNRKI